jgi:uncharacterized protein YjbI with pentapeptide repeats
VPPPGVQRIVSRARTAAPYLPWAALALVVALVAVAALLFLFLRLVPDWIATADDDITSVRTGVLAFLAGLVAVIGAVYTARTYALNRRGQLTDRFSRAIEQLGNESLDVRLGGIYSLERIARESPEDHGPVIDVLTAYVRDHAAWRRRAELEREGPAPQFQNWMGPPPANWPPITPDRDVQAALTVLARRQVVRVGDEAPLELSNVDLRGARLSGARLERSRLADSHLEDAFLLGAKLAGARLVRVHSEGANLSNADLRGADLNRACLDGVFAVDADFGSGRSTDVWIATSLIRASVRYAHLQGVNLSSATLENADLTGSLLFDADLSHARLSGTHLEGADLSSAQLDDADLKSATYSSATRWPHDFDARAAGAVRND